MKRILLFGIFVFSSTTILSNTPNYQNFSDTFQKLTQEDQKKLIDINTARETLIDQLMQLEARRQNVTNEKFNSIKEKIEKDKDGKSLTPEEKKIALIKNTEDLQQMLSITKNQFAQLITEEIIEKSEGGIDKKANNISKKIAEEKPLTIEEIIFILVSEIATKEYEFRQLLNASTQEATTSSQKK